MTKRVQSGPNVTRTASSVLRDPGASKTAGGERTDVHSRHRQAARGATFLPRFP